MLCYWYAFGKARLPASCLSLPHDLKCVLFPPLESFLSKGGKPAFQPRKLPRSRGKERRQPPRGLPPERVWRGILIEGTSGLFVGSWRELIISEVWSNLLPRLAEDLLEAMSGRLHQWHFLTLDIFIFGQPGCDLVNGA